MGKNRLVTTMLLVIIVLTLLVVGGFILWRTYLNPSNKAEAKQASTQVTADEFQKVTMQTDEIPTNLLTGEVIDVQFAIQAENEKTKAELDERKAQVTYIIIKTLESLKPADVEGAKGMEKMENDIQSELNKILEEGKVVKVMTTHKVVQE